MSITNHEEYINDVGLSQSHLKTITDPYTFFKERQKKRTVKKHFEIGTAVDLAVAYGLTALRDSVEMLEMKPEKKIHKLAEFLVENDLEPTEENILFAREECRYNSRLKSTTVVNQFETEALWYYTTLTENADKILLTEQDLYLVLTVYQSLTTNKFTKSHIVERENIVRLSHAHIYFRYKGVRCKAELDQIEVDLNNMLVRPIDFKTLYESTREFPNAVKKRRYDIQAAFYLYALDRLMHGDAESDIKMDLSPFRMLPFRFVVETTNPDRVGINPMVFDASPDMIYGGRYGIYPEKRYTLPVPTSANEYFQRYTKLPGFDSLIEEYLFQISQPPEDRVYNKGEITELQEKGAIILNPW